MKRDRKGRKLLECVEETGWLIWKEEMNGDESGEYRYKEARGRSVIRDGERGRRE